MAPNIYGYLRYLWVPKWDPNFGNYPETTGAHNLIRTTPCAVSRTFAISAKLCFAVQRAAEVPADRVMGSGQGLDAKRLWL